MSKISELSDGGALQSTDYLIAVRSGGNVKVRPNGAVSGTTGQFSTSLNVDGTVTADGLTVDKTSQSTIVATSDSTVDVRLVADTSLTEGSLRTSGTTPNLGFYVGGTKYANISDGGDISFYEDTGTTPKFFWDASAEALGIGTTSPIGSFTVADSGTPVASPASLATIHSSTSSKYFLKLTSADFNANGNWVGLGLGYSSSYLKSAIISEAKDTYGRANLHFALNSATSSDSASLSDSRMVIDYNGNVGIGNISPNAKFTNYKNTSISGSAGATLSLEDDSQPRMMMVADSSTSYISSFNSNPITFSVTAGNFSSSTGTERMRLDASGNLLVGTTDASVHIGTTSGAVLRSDGFGFFAVSGNSPIYANRLTDDGAIIDLRKDGAQVGSIASHSGGFLKIATAGNQAGLLFGTSAIYPIKNSAIDDAAVDLGGSSERFKDLYLSGVAKVDSYINLGNNSYIRADASGELRFQGGSTATTFYNAGNSSEYMRIDSNGNLFVGTTVTYPGVSGLGGNIKGMMSEGGGSLFLSRVDSNPVLYINRGGTDGDSVRFAKDAGSTVGSISVTASATAYNTSSDARLKENIADAESASELIDAIQVRSFDWKADGSHQRYGMVAQELLEVVPEAVSQPEDPDEMMGVDYSKLVPMLVKEIQSLRARVAQLEGV